MKYVPELSSSKIKIGQNWILLIVISVKIKNWAFQEFWFTLEFKIWPTRLMKIYIGSFFSESFLNYNLTVHVQWKAQQMYFE